MDIKSIRIADAKSKVGSYDYVTGTTISSIVVGTVKEFDNTLWDEILDVHFFSATSEIHVFQDDGLKAVEFIEEEKDDFNELHAEVDKTVPGCTNYNRLIIREYYDYDSDGQVLVKYTRPVKLV